MNRIPVLVLLILVPALALPQAGQQKKRSATTQQSTEKAAARTADQQPDKVKEGFRETILKYVGISTNLGTLMKVGPDFIVFEEDGAQMILALSAVVSVKEIPPMEDEEGAQKTLEIHILARD
jgi:hypothetical protein